MTRYEKQVRREAKFWEIARKGLVVSTRAGKIDLNGHEGRLTPYDVRARTTNRQFTDPDDAHAAYDKLVKAKEHDGWTRVDAMAPPTAIALHVNADLEAAIDLAHNDPEPYSVYADWLIAKGDLRGELVTLQHAMRVQRDPAKFLTLRRREQALRAAHLASWLGEIAGRALHRLEIEWRNGFIDGVAIDGAEGAGEPELHEVVTAVLASPITRFLRGLTLRGTSRDVADAAPARPPIHLQVISLLIDSGNLFSSRHERDHERNRRHRTYYESRGILVNLNLE